MIDITREEAKILGLHVNCANWEKAPPLWVVALVERITDRVAAELGVRAEDVPRTEVRGRQFTEARQRIAREVYAVYPHVNLISRAWGPRVDAVRAWIRYERKCA